MGEQSGGPTLEGLAQRLETQVQRLETLERENTELRSKIATLEGSEARRDKVAELGGSGAHRDGKQRSVLEGRVSRRSLLGTTGAAAIATLAAGTLLNARPAKAEHLAPGIDVDYVNTHFVTASGFRDRFSETIVYANNTGAGSAVYAENNGGGGASSPVIHGKANGAQGTGVFGYGAAEGVAGVSPAGNAVDGRTHATGGTGVFGSGDTGVWGRSSRTGWSGVYGEHTGTSGYGVVGDGKGESGAGVLGRNPDGTGVLGQTSQAGYGGITGEHTGTSGYGVIGLGKGSANSGVLGRNSSGYGGQFEGGKAQLRLKPGGSAGKPTTGTHTKGEIYMDSAGTLFVCTASTTSTTAAKWKRVSATAV